MPVREFQFRGKPYKVACVETTPSHASWFSFEDEVSVRSAHWSIEPGDVVFDVGACYGSYTLTALACGAKKVFAWSPPGPPPDGDDPEAWLLRKSLALNGWSDRCEVYEWGLYDRVGWLDTEWYGPGSDLTFLKEHRGGKFVIEVRTLDGWFSLNRDLVPFAPAYWMKIDVEGAEEAVINGGKGLIAQLKPYILLENHYFRRVTIEDEVRRAVEKLGYRHVVTAPHNDVSHSLYVPR